MATTDIYTLSLHDALPISSDSPANGPRSAGQPLTMACSGCPNHVTASVSARGARNTMRSEEHTSELQSHSDLVCRLLLEKKKKEERIDMKSKSTPAALYSS